MFEYSLIFWDQKMLLAYLISLFPILTIAISQKIPGSFNWITVLETNTSSQAHGLTSLLRGCHSIQAPIEDTANVLENIFQITVS